MMNVLSYVHAGDKLILNRVDTFIGRTDRDEYVYIGQVKHLSSLETIFRYTSFVQEQEMYLDIYLD